MIRYTKDHEWVRLDGTVATVGITSHAQDALGDLVFIELPEPGREVIEAEAIAVVESVKAASDVYAPLAGRVTEVNGAARPRIRRWSTGIRPARAGSSSSTWPNPASLRGPYGPGRLRRAAGGDGMMDALAEIAALDESFVPPPHRFHRGRHCDHAPRIVGAESLEALAAQTVPGDIRIASDGGAAGRDRRNPGDRGAAPAGRAEPPPALADRAGLSRHLHAPGDPQRNVLENPGWYTAYTPYQAELAQGRLEALLNFQTMVCRPDGHADRQRLAAGRGDRRGRGGWPWRMPPPAPRPGTIAVCTDLHPQTAAVLATRAHPLGWTLQEFRPRRQRGESAPTQPFAVVLQYPGTSGAVRDLHAEIAAAHEAGALAIVCADLLSLVLLTPPGEMGADVVVGSSQRFGVPVGFGGPHAAFFATKDKFKRVMPGRLVGVSQDAAGHPAMRLACRPASSTSAARRPPATSAPRRSCWP